MNKKEIEKGIAGDLTRARFVAQLFRSEGWKIYDKMKKEKLKELRDINSCKDEIELKARQRSIKILEDLDEGIKAIEEQADEALKMKEKIEGNN